MARVDLNSDLGESFGRYSLGLDDQVIPLVTSVNIACGMHAGDPCVMRRTVAAAAAAGTSIGAHPGYPDLQGFGRRDMALSPDEAYSFVLYQISALAGFCKAEGTALAHVKPHGQLYNRAAKDAALAEAIAAAVHDFDPTLVLVGLAGGKLIVEPVAVPRDKMVPIRRAGGRYLAEKRKLTLPTRYFKVEEGDALFGAVLDFLKELCSGEGE